MELENPDIRSALQPIEGLYTEMSTIDGGTALVFRPDQPDWSNTLRTIDASHGYWIRLNAAATLTVHGARAESGAVTLLDAGWNMVSYLPGSPLPVRAALASLEGSYDEVRGFDGEALSYFPGLPPQFSTLSVLDPGKGYLIHLTEAAVLFYP